MNYNLPQKEDAMRRTPLNPLVLSVTVCLVAGLAFGQTRDSGKQTEGKRTAKTEKNGS